ncbi:MAG: AraC family transcriptional regulator [Myxococcaceae bacterium]|nr:AraC family transcriptional regulator [Myxococcaceae bacterium]MCI0670146.1 AraC family transcriptional regulator [Myxococcaceae bacterium]
MSDRDSLLAQIGADVVRFQDASTGFDEAARAVLALGRADMACLARLHFEGSVPLDRLAESLGPARGELGTAVERLELAGYARRTPGGAGGGERLELTEHARRWVETLWGPLQADGFHLLAPLPVEELRVIARFLSAALAVQEQHASRVRALLEIPGTTRTTRLRGGLSPAALRRVQLFVEANLGRPLHLQDLAQRSGLSPFHFARAFKQSMGVTPHAFVQQRRVERARELLRTSDRSLGEVALETGFSSQSHFTTVFRRVTGLTPSVVRRGGR